MADELIITLDFDTPPPAGELGDFFSALARDYRDLTKGRTLVVSRIETGSLIAVVQDIAQVVVPLYQNSVDVAIGIVALAELAKLLKNGLNRAKTDTNNDRTNRKRRKERGHRSIESLVKIAASTGCAVRIEHTAQNGERLEVDLMPQQAIDIQERARQVESIQTSPPISSTPRVSEQLTKPEMQRVVDRIYDASTSLPYAEAQVTIDVLIDVLNAAGLLHLVPQISRDLEARGLVTLASAMRAKMQTLEKGKTIEDDW